VLRLACINLLYIELVDKKQKTEICENRTNLRLVDKVGDVTLVLRLGNICTPTRHEFDIVDTPFLPFELEVTVDCEEESVEKSTRMDDKDQ
jgi:hypothetical protein